VTDPRATGAQVLAAAGGGWRPDAVVTHHRNPFRSGVARFNQILAEHLGVPLVGLDELAAAGARAPLLSFKAGELPGEPALDALAGTRYGVFLHAWDGLALEERLVRGATRVFCGNEEVRAAVLALGVEARTLWAPGLILGADAHRYAATDISIFSFGMAHKLRADRFARLRELLEATGRSYALYISSANHETATMRDADLVHAQMRDLFPGHLYFLGNLSDVAVFNHLVSTTFFAAFFEHGARANNTSIASAMEHGAVVITNLDEHSPPDLVHLDNVIDVNRAEALPSDPLELKRLSVRAMETARGRSWERLVAEID
jgi:hypothetical protein